MSRARRVGEWRYRVPMATPASRAIFSREASTPCAANSRCAAARSLSRRSWASRRRGLRICSTALTSPTIPRMPRAASVYLLLASPARTVDHGALEKFDVDDGAVLDLDVVGFPEGVATRG